MYYFYIIQSTLNLQEIYAGSTNNLRARFKAHNDGEVTSTKRYRPWRLAYYEAYSSEKDARTREQKFKRHGKGNDELKKRIKNSMNKNNKKGEGFTLIEILIVIAIIGMIATIGVVALSGARDKARDTKRKSDLYQIGRFFSLSCYLPDDGEGEYDLIDIIAELKVKYPQYAKYVSDNIKDPKSGTALESYYMYRVVDNGNHCVLYANLEHEGEEVTLTGISVATPDGRTGVYQAPAAGWNGSTKYYQISK